jgi:hypothetical protein
MRFRSQTFKGFSTIGIGTGLLLAAGMAFAANGIDVKRGEDATVFGTCVPTLTVENRSAETIDFLQVDLVIALADGRERTVELRSAYREGVLYPIAPGATAALKQQLDLSPSLGVACGEIKTRRVVRTICEAGGKACSFGIQIDP